LIYALLAVVTAAILFGLIQIGDILRVAFSSTKFVNWTSLFITVGLATACVVVVAWLGPIVFAGLFL
jgi:hypothetical protein